MKFKTFSFIKGIKLPKLVAENESSAITELDDPAIFYVSMRQSTGKEATVVVQIGERVKRGTVIGKSSQMNIFSPCSGLVREVVMRPSAMGGISKHVVIENDYKKDTEVMPEITSLTAVNILKRIFDAGIVDCGGEPLFKKLIIEKGREIKGILINACSDEPYITNNLSILKNYGEQVLSGAKFVSIATGIDNVVFAMNKTTHLKSSNFMAQLSAANLQFGVDGEPIRMNFELFADKYPIGDEQELLYALTKKRIKFGENAQSVGYIMINLKSLLAVFSAVVSGMPDYITLLTLVGCDKRMTSACWVKAGTEIKHIAQTTVQKDRQKNLVKVVAGGPMSGIALSDLSVSSIKGMNAIMFLTDEDIYVQEETNCINCGNCVRVCPRNLVPNKIDQCFNVGDYVGAHKFGATYCSECGCCAFVCPAKRHLVQRIAISKEEILKKGINKWR